MGELRRQDNLWRVVGGRPEPEVNLYRQMAIRQQKQHNYGLALWWAERGITLYGNDAARPEAVDDLRNRAIGYRAKMELETCVPSRPAPSAIDRRGDQA